MKIALFALFFLLFSFTKAEFVYDTDSNPILKFVYDIDGNPILNYELYDILVGVDPIVSGYLSLLNYEKQSCPLSVVEAIPYYHSPPELPAKICNSRIHNEYILTDMPVNFTFPDTPHCHYNSKWYVTEYLPPLGHAVRFGDAEVTPHGKGHFKIIRHNGNGYNYKILFCSEENSETCGALSTRMHKNNKILVVIYETDSDRDPLFIRFQKKGRASSTSGTSMVV